MRFVLALLMIGACAFAQDAGIPGLAAKLGHQLAKLLRNVAAPQLSGRARDGQPLVVCWDVDLSKARTWAKTTPVLAYEKQGADGNRYVLTMVRSVELLSDKDFREASFPLGHNPGS